MLCVFRHHFPSPPPTTMRPEDSCGGNPDRPKAESPTDTDLHVHTCRERKKKKARAALRHTENTKFSPLSRSNCCVLVMALCSLFVKLWMTAFPAH